MNDIIYYTELIRTLTTQIDSVAGENVELKKRLSNCEGKLEMLKLFYSDFKDLIKTEITIPDDILSDETASSIAMPKYENLLSEYLVTKDVDIAERLFNDRTVSPSQVLTDIRNALPENIAELVKRYNCVKEYKIILASLKHIKKFTESGHFTEKGIMDLVEKYITAYTKEKKDLTLKYIKQALVFFPFQFDKFLINTRSYQYDDAEQRIEALKVELYGENNILLTNKNVEKKSRKSRTTISYETFSVPELIEYAKGVTSNQRQRAVQILDGMRKVGRSEDDCSLYVKGVNEFLKNNI